MKVNKVEIASCQLKLAIHLYVTKENLISAITLAGAAGEIFRKLLEKRGVQKSTIQLALKIYELEGNPKKAKDLITALNLYKNAFKHADRDPDEIIDFDEVAESHALIVDALSNYASLDIHNAYPLIEAFYPHLDDV